MRETYKKELDDLKIKMEKAEIFAETLPDLSEQILERKFTGDEHWIDFGDNGEQMFSTWKIKRGFFDSETTRYVTNYSKPHKEFLFSIYINCYSLFDVGSDFEVERIASQVPLFFYDSLNTTFYATDGQFADLLKALKEWHTEARKKATILKENQRIEKAQKEIESAKAKIDSLI